MAARFRCPECNRPLRDHDNDHSGGSVLKCPYCGARMVVPTYLAGAPQPQTDPPTPITPDDAPEMPLHDPVVLPVMARSMPWLVSMCFHVALAMIFMFVAMIIVLDDPPDVGVPAGCSFMPKDMTPINDITHRTKPRLSDLRKRLDKRTNKSDPGRKLETENESSQDNSRKSLDAMCPDESQANLIGTAMPDGNGKFFGIPSGGGGGGGGLPGDGMPNVVYLIDRSGSMIDTFRTVCNEMLQSVRRMTKENRFHVVLFSDGRPLEKSPQRLTRATDKVKVNLVKFLKPISASGRTDPIPAINRAFDVLERKGGAAGRGGVIYLLTDGAFPNNEAVLKTIRRRNSAKRVRINTILHGNRPPIAEKVMARIAANNGGTYRFVSPDE